MSEFAKILETESVLNINVIKYTVLNINLSPFQFNNPFLHPLFFYFFNGYRKRTFA